MLRRRKNILFSLLGATIFFFLVNAIHGSRLVELLALLTFLALAFYVGLLIQLKKVVFG
jgi:Ca2+/Na+ antiporter